MCISIELTPTTENRQNQKVGFHSTAAHKVLLFENAIWECSRIQSLKFLHNKHEKFRFGLEALN